MRVFVTIGSTKFDSLVEAALSPPVISALREKGYTELHVQCGNSHVDDLGMEERRVEEGGVSIKLWRFKPSLEGE